MSRKAPAVASGPKGPDNMVQRPDSTTPETPFAAAVAAQTFAPAKEGERRFSSPFHGLVIQRKIFREQRDSQGNVTQEAHSLNIKFSAGEYRTSDPAEIEDILKYMKKRPGHVVDVDATMALAEESGTQQFLAKLKSNPKLRERLIKEVGADIFVLPSKQEPPKQDFVPQ